MVTKAYNALYEMELDRLAAMKKELHELETHNQNLGALSERIDRIRFPSSIGVALRDDDAARIDTLNGTMSEIHGELAKISESVRPAEPQLGAISPGAAFVLAWLTQLQVAYLDKYKVTVHSTNAQLQALRAAATHEQCRRLLATARPALCDAYDALIADVDARTFDDATLGGELMRRLGELMRLEWRVVAAVRGDAPAAPPPSPQRQTAARRKST